jgi:hypothetical protein
VTEPLTFDRAQDGQPWTVPYSDGVVVASGSLVHHILGSHAVLHASKTVGKLAAVFEVLDHRPVLTAQQGQTIRDMAADLVSAALRLANLYGFRLADELERRVEEKNGCPIAGREPLPRQEPCPLAVLADDGCPNFSEEDEAS